MFMKSHLDKRSALQGLLNSNGCELAGLNATVAFFFSVAIGDRASCETATALLSAGAGSLCQRGQGPG